MRIAIGLSGGVDSCVAAWLLKEAGHEVVGVTMDLRLDGVLPKELPGNACFGPASAKSIADASAFAERIGIEYRPLPCGEEYSHEILGYFRRTYMEGRTPNPCVLCNAVMKFGLLPRLARESGIAFDRFATGHYARLERRDGRVALLRARDLDKDQSYFLCRLSQEQLSMLMFPLGEMTKREVREIAAKAGFAAASRPDSQDFYSGDRDDIVDAPPREGDIVSTDGRVLGRHDGFWHYTIGQRKGLGFACGKPLYVVRLDADRNEVVVGTREEACGTALQVDDVNWVSVPPVASPLECRVKIRSTGDPKGPAVFENGICRMSSGLFGITPGQYAVFYGIDSDELLCAGAIRGQVAS